MEPPLAGPEFFEGQLKWATAINYSLTCLRLHFVYKILFFSLLRPLKLVVYQISCSYVAYVVISPG